MTMMDNVSMKLYEYLTIIQAKRLMQISFPHEDAPGALLIEKKRSGTESAASAAARNTKRLRAPSAAAWFTSNKQQVTNNKSFERKIEMLGVVVKKPVYLTRIKGATDKLKMPGHPINNGIAMQAHHLVSEKGIKMSKRGQMLQKFRYDINSLENLAYIPCTLKGACHLGVQPHRGNHTAVSDDLDKDGNRPLPYHKAVEKAIKMLSFPETCGEASYQKVQKAMDDISKKLLNRIQNVDLMLTKVGKNFPPNNPAGCGGVKGVGDTPNPACPDHRDHFGQEDEGKITIKKQNYRLKVGQ